MQWDLVVLNLLGCFFVVVGEHCGKDAQHELPCIMHANLVLSLK